MTDKNFDAIVIGGGPGGYVCAIRLAQLGFKTACVEARDTLGGTCLNVGCIPSKALLESSHHFHRAQHEFENHGIETGKVKANIKRMIARKDEVIDSNVQGIEFLFKKNGITWLKGFGSLEGDGKVKVSPKKGDADVYSAKHIILATGSEPIEIPPAKYDHKHICDSTDALEWDKAPKELVVIGGGVIGLELGSVWNRLGSNVVVVEAMDKILGPTDKSVSNGLLKALKKEGMTIHTKTMLQSTEVKGGKVNLVCEQKGEKVEFSADKVLVAVGRKPYTDKLGLDKAGVKVDDRGRVDIDAHFKTNVEGVYAIGDVVKGPMLAHKAEDEGVALAEILAGQAGHIDYNLIPGIIYTWPEVATVGKSEEELKASGVKFKKGQFNFKANGRAKAMGDDDGLVKILAHADTDEILGAHIVGPNASELIAEIVVAMEFKASSEDVARTVHAHPTLSEAVKEAALAVDGRAIHS
jgi:dihydrolipoamide dehydrogenase